MRENGDDGLLPCFPATARNGLENVSSGKGQAGSIFHRHFHGAIRGRLWQRLITHIGMNGFLHESNPFMFTDYYKGDIGFTGT